jgi:hypothetical protein
MFRVVKCNSVRLGAQTILCAVLCLSCIGCKWIYMRRLPIEVTIVDSTTGAPLRGATAKLVWRVGVGGIIWGKSTVLSADEDGVVRFSKENMPALDELGGPLPTSMDYVMIDRVIIKADGYQTLCVRPPRSRLPAVLMLQRGANPVDEAESPVPESAGPAKLQTKARSVSNVVDVGSQPAGE